MQQDKVLFFKSANVVQHLMCAGMLAAPMIIAWSLGLSVTLLVEAQALMAAALIYLGYVIVAVLIILQLKADSTRGKLALSKLVVRSKLENGGLSAVSCIVAFRSDATK